MAQIVVMPALGNTVESCLLSSWHVAVGDTVDETSTLCEIETDKAMMDVPSTASGTVLALLVAEGDDVPVKDAILILGAPGEDISDLLGSGSDAASNAGAGEPTGAASGTPAASDAGTSIPAGGAPGTPAQSGPASAAAPAGAASATSADAVPASSAAQASTTSADAPGVSPRARGLAAREGIVVDAAGTGPHGRVIERDVVAALAAGPRPTAGTRGADLSGVSQGTGIGGRVTRADLAAVPLARLVTDGAPSTSAPSASAPQAAAPAASTPREFPGAYSDTPLKGIRKLIAERMLNALATSAQLTYTATADASGMLALRKRFKASDPALGYAAITLGDLVSFATAQTLKSHANLNAHLIDGTLRAFTDVHLGLAVDTPRGLLVPTIRNADALTLRQLSVETKRLAGAARDGKIDPELLSGATFTVSNLGSFGIESFTPIINVPQTGILGVNTISPRAAVNQDGTVGVQQRIGFSLTADHQVVDGADAGRFLAALCAAIENIDLVVMG